MRGKKKNKTQSHVWQSAGQKPGKQDGKAGGTLKGRKKLGSKELKLQTNQLKRKGNNCCQNSGGRNLIHL